MLPFMEKQSEYLFIGDHFGTYGMDYSHEIFDNKYYFKKIHILDDFRGIWVSYCIEGLISKLPDLIKLRSFLKSECIFLNYSKNRN